jgi:hypothetical protein
MKIPRLPRFPRLALCFACALVSVHAQTPTPAAVPPPPAPAPAPAPADEAGFVAMFDGKTLEGWDGDPIYWRVENGCMVGEITPETIVKRNTFIIWRGGSPKDFELKVAYRISATGNSGINYRSWQLTDAKWSLAGYQSDIDGAQRNRPPLRHTGQNYEERGRTFLARRGEVVRVGPDGKPQVIGSVGESEALKAFIKEDDWNEFHLIASGNVLTHILNGHVMSVVIDNDPERRKAEGLIGVQVHVGPPMKVEYRNFRLKQL